MRRDRFTVAMLVGLPSVQLLLFGYAIRTEVRHVPMVVLDHSRTQESRALITLLTNTQNFDVAGHLSGQKEADDLLATGGAKAALIIPPDFSRRLQAGTHAPGAGRGGRRGSARRLGGDLGGRAGERDRHRGPHPRHASQRPAIDVRVRPRYNPGLVSAYNIVPGLIGVLLTMTLVAITSMALVRERERGTLEQLIVTPVTRTSVILGKILPFVIVGYVQMSRDPPAGPLHFRCAAAGQSAAALRADPSRSSSRCWAWGC